MYILTWNWKLWNKKWGTAEFPCSFNGNIQLFAVFINRKKKHFYLFFPEPQIGWKSLNYCNTDTYKWTLHFFYDWLKKRMTWIEYPGDYVFLLFSVLSILIVRFYVLSKSRYSYFVRFCHQFRIIFLCATHHPSIVNSFELEYLVVTPTLGHRPRINISVLWTHINL